MAFVLAVIISGLVGDAIVITGLLGVILVNILLSSYDIKTEVVELREILTLLKDKENEVE